MRYQFITTLWIGLIAFIILPLSAYGQEELSFYVADSKTNEPVENAFLFIENTSIGTITSLDGRAFLPYQEDDQYTIVITHILYETAYLSKPQITSGLNTILLQ